MLFLGSGLGDRYLLELFNQMVELYGPGTLPHFVMAPAGELDADFLRRCFGIWVHEVAHHEDVPRVISSLPVATGRHGSDGRRTP